jgi:hypothetical protein
MPYSDSVLNEKKSELLGEKIANDEYLDEALLECFAEIRALLSARTLDDKLSALDDLVKKIHRIIVTDEQLEKEAKDYLDKCDAWRDAA